MLAGRFAVKASGNRSSTALPQPANHARFIFLDPSAPEFFAEWDRAASDTIAILRAEAGRNPHDRALSGLIGELSTRSETSSGSTFAKLTPAGRCLIGYLASPAGEHLERACWPARSR